MSTKRNHRQYTKLQRSRVVEDLKLGFDIPTVSKLQEIPESTIRTWIKQENERLTVGKALRNVGRWVLTGAVGAVLGVGTFLLGVFGAVYTFGGRAEVEFWWGLLRSLF